MRTVKLNELKITKINSDGEFIPHPIWKSDYYEALALSDKDIYEGYHQKLQKHHYSRAGAKMNEMSFSEFEDLYQDISSNGFKIQEPHIDISEDNIVLDGQHRVVILYLIDPFAELTIDEEGHVIGYDQIYNQKRRSSNT